MKTTASHKECDRRRILGQSWLGPRTVLVAAVVAGGVLRGWQYLANASLWLDELALANNVIQRNVVELLTQPLDFAQVAPLGYVVALKVAVWLGGSELQLRFYSFVCGLASVVLTAVLARDVLGIRVAWAPTLLVALSSPLIVQSAQVKPYSGDCMLVLGCLLLATRVSRAQALQRPLRWAAVGVVAPWFSFPLVFALAAVAVAVLAQLRRRVGQAHTRAVVGALLACALSSAAAAYASLASVSPATREFMRAYWEDGFPTLPPESLSQALWPLSMTRDLLQELGVGDFPGAGILAVVTVIGLVSLAKQRSAGLLLVPLIGAFAAALLKQYPLAGRVALWALPLTAIALTAGIVALLSLLPRRIADRSSIGGLVFLGTVSVFTLVTRPFPHIVQHTRPLLRHLVEASQPNDVVYVYYGAWQAWTYYAPRLRPVGLKAIMGSCSKADRSVPVTELQKLETPGRLWLFISHAEHRLRERELLTGFLSIAGARLIEELNEPSPFVDSSDSAAALLYDLRDARLRGTDGSRAIAAVLDAVPGPSPGCWPPVVPRFLDQSPLLPN